VIISGVIILISSPTFCSLASSFLAVFLAPASFLVSFLSVDSSFLSSVSSVSSFSAVSYFYVVDYSFAPSDLAYD